MNLKVSIVVPIYNSEKYLSECLDSIISQTLKDIQIILVDDGSTDNSLKICNYYANIDSRIMVIHQTNEGQVSAQKKGLMYAEGKYVGFVDSDDWIETNMYEELVKFMELQDVDLVTSGYYRKGGDSYCSKITDRLVEKKYFTDADKAYLYTHFLKTCGTEGMIYSKCVKLYNAEILRGCMNDVSKDVITGEDCVLNFIYIQRAKSVYICHEAFYNYRMHSQSIVHRNHPDYLIQVNRLYIELIRASENLPCKDIVKEQIDRMIVKMTIQGLNRLGLYKNIYIPQYKIDISELQGYKIVVYGGGVVGVDLYNQLKVDSQLKVVLWVDKNWEKLCSNNPNIVSPEIIKKIEYDKILIAVKSRLLAEKIEAEIERDYGIDNKYIIWLEPKEYLFE